MMMSWLVSVQHLPPLKSKLLGGPGTLFSGAGASDNIDSMSVNGSIVSNGSMTSVAGAGQTNGVNGHGHSNGHSNVHTNGMATLPHVRPTTGGDTVSRNSTLDSPKHDSASTQNGTGSGSTSSLMKPKTMVATPEQVMKLYMNKLTPYEHHEIFNYPQIYFIGANAKKRPGIIGGPNNCGYDDEQVKIDSQVLSSIFVFCLKKYHHNRKIISSWTDNYNIILYCLVAPQPCNMFSLFKVFSVPKSWSMFSKC